MQLVINVSDYDLEYIRNMYDIPKDISVSIAEALLNGRKIPPHGRLIDANELGDRMRGKWTVYDYEALGASPTIIEREE